MRHNQGKAFHLSFFFSGLFTVSLNYAVQILETSVVTNSRFSLVGSWWEAALSSILIISEHLRTFNMTKEGMVLIWTSITISE